MIRSLNIPAVVTCLVSLNCNQPPRAQGAGLATSPPLPTSSTLGGSTPRPSSSQTPRVVTTAPTATAAPTNAKPKPQPSPYLDAVAGPGIGCGQQVCKIGTFCCRHRFGGAHRCLAARDTNTCDQMLVACDDSADCLRGQVCCDTFDESYSPHRICSSVPCKRGPEVCQPGGKCAAGYQCVAMSIHPGGRCYYSAVRVRCGSQVCQGTKPACRYDWKKRSGICVAHKDVKMNRDGIHFACDGHDDCGTGNVCVHPIVGGTYCSGPQAYDTTLTNATIVCQNDRDCPKTYRKFKCRNAKHAPAGIKVCEP